jgi:hypothetical protein
MTVDIGEIERIWQSEPLEEPASVPEETPEPVEQPSPA